MAATLETQLDILQTWLQEIASNTARIRDAAEKKGAAKTTEKKKKEEPSWVATLTRKIEGALGTVAGRGLGQAQSLAARGMQGTLESARLEYAMDQLGRQFAAVMLPVTQGLTYFAGKLETMMRGMNGTEQNRLMGSILGGIIGSRFGPVGAMAGFVGGSGMLMGGTSSSDAFAGAAVGAYAGYRLGGPVGALAGGALGAARAAPRSYEDERPFDYYSRMRAGGATRVGAAFSMASESLSRIVSNPLPGAPPPPRPPEPRRDVTPFQADMMEAGGTYFKAQQQIIRSTAGPDYEDAGPLKPIVDGMLEIIKLLAKIAGVDLTTPPPAGAR